MLYKVEGHPVFLDRARYERLFVEAGKDRDWQWRISARIDMGRGCPADRAVYEILKTHYRKDPPRFDQDWINFDYQGADAGEMIVDLLQAYSDWYGHCAVKYSLKEDGCIINLLHTVKPWRWWWRFTHRMMNREIALKIETNRVRRVTGAIHCFRVLYGDIGISFAENIQIE